MIARQGRKEEQQGVGQKQLQFAWLAGYLQNAWPTSELLSNFWWHLQLFVVLGGEEGQRDDGWSGHHVADIVESNKRFNRTTTQKLSGKNKFKCKHNA